MDRVEQFLAHSTLELAQAIVVPLMMFIFMLRLHWVMALVMLIPMILGIAVPMMMVKNYPDMSAELAEDTEKTQMLLPMNLSRPCQSSKCTT